MADQRDFYLKIFEDFPALIWRSGTDMLCDYFNHTWLNFTGRTLDQERGNGWAEGVHTDDLGRCLKIYADNFALRQPFEMVYRLMRHDGEYRWIQDLGRPFYGYDGEFLGYIGSCYDITEKHLMTLKLEEANQTKNLLFSIISHDLKGPVGAVLHYLNLILDHEGALDGPELLEDLKKLQKTTSDVEVLLENLLDWSRGQLNALKVSPHPFSVRGLLDEILPAFQGILGAKNITTVWEGDPAPLVMVDRNMAQVIFRNLLSNALKFSFPGGRVQIRSYRDQDWVVVEFQDHGQGISPERLATIWDVSPSKSTKGTAGERGSGLGLILCRDFTEKNGGSLTIDSHLGEGTLVRVRLPGSSW